MAIHEARKQKIWVGAIEAGTGRVRYLPKNNPHMQPEPTRFRYVHVDEKGNELAPAQYVFLESKT